MKVYAYSLSLICLGMLSGCARFYQRTEQPAVEMPAQFSHYKEDSSKITPQALANWWHCFKDPVLQELIQRAFAKNYDLRIAFEKIEETRCQYRIKTADLLPQIDGFSVVTRNRFSKDVPLLAALTKNPDSFAGVGLSASWEIDIFGRLRSARKAAYADYRAQIEQMHDVYIILAADVATYYIEARALEKNMHIRKQQLEIDQELLYLSQDLFKGGLLDATATDIQIQQLQESANAVAQTEKRLLQTYQTLAVLLGEIPETFALPVGNNQVPLSHVKLSPGLPSELVRRRPDIRQAEQKLIASDERVREAIAGYFPKFSLLGYVASLSTIFCKMFDGNSLAWTIGPAASWPLLSFGRITYDVKAKKSSQRQALLTYSQTVVQAFADVEKAFINYVTQQERLAIYEKKLKAITQEANLVQGRFQAGLADRSQYLVTQKSRLEVESQLIDIQKELSSALIGVYKSLGGGWEDVTHCA